MQRSTFKVLFYVKRQSEKSGQVPVMGRITINGTMSQFSCKLSVRSSLWDAKANKAAGRSLESQRINEKLENIKTNIGKQYQRLCDRDSYVTAEKVRNAFLGMGDDCRLLLQTFDEYLAGFLMQFILALRHNAQAFAEEGDSALVIHMQADEDGFFFGHLMIIPRT